MSRTVRLTLATVAVAVAVLLTVLAYAVDSLWVTVAAGFGVWPVAAIAAHLTWSALRHGGVR